MKLPGMMFCRCCGKEIHESAPACPQCGGLQHAAPAAVARPGEPGLWLPIGGLICGLLSAMALLDDAPLDHDTATGIFLFSVIGLVFGIVSMRNQEAGKKMAIAAVILSVIALLALIGNFVD
ncbi:DUF4190 domain-containing protein [Massilia sp. Dwa41.01b]|uniref:DUF4190 domain-containing protein n=1 Tax=unclassified Massilia TaxID=2609279 RepID=UPI001601624E|nr:MULTISPECIES: DUF4190 domain-containing protein [unclassified Massilia]QNA88831.1 DUF4190 domain-containing protein [Massilia sp. Dwa41.01b]QNA99726.1 DUF4190 domain-containing protein [Massilia sp. Se16.2.3]